jgi:hypothetical protein
MPGTASIGFLELAGGAALLIGVVVAALGAAAAISIGLLII